MRKWVLGALLATIAGTPAMAQDGGRRGGWRGGDGSPRAERPQGSGQDGGGWQGRRNGGGFAGAQVEAARQARAQAQSAAVAPDRSAGRDRNNDARADIVRRDRDGDGRTDRWARDRNGDGRPDQFARDRNGDGRPDTFARDRNGDGRRDQFTRDRNGDGRPDQFARDRNGDGRPDRWNNASRFDNRNAGRFDNRQGYSGNGWSRDWRQDGRYDWNRFRSGNRYAYRLPRYYAPYGWNYGYRRFSIGVTLSSVLWGQNYWIDDPYSYRLPPAYGPYRWVRYYNDALLVDIRTGEVIDMVSDIFWG